ncbi:MAG: FkbM family methyltransferase [Sulfitobacter sp.]|nr:FkbM family methyltransferase [Sulfitobacter sp.]
MSSSTKKPLHVAECRGIKVPANPALNEERLGRINAERYERHEIAGALEVVKPGDRVLELGAGIGLVGAVTLKNAKPSKVLAYEANPDLIPHIEALYKLNKLGKKIEIRNKILVSDPKAPKSLPFHVRNSYLGSSLIDTTRRPTRAIKVPTESYASVHKSFKPDVIIMDIEGGELEFLRHADLKGVRAIVVEFHPEAYGRDGMRECKRLLEHGGFVKESGPSTRTVWTVTHAPDLTMPMPDTGWTREMEELEKAYVVPPDKQNFVQQAGVLRADGSYCEKGALWRNGRILTEEPEKPQGRLPTRKGTWLWGGVLWMHFGHFIVESSSRLWALEHLKKEIDGILFVPKRPRNGSEVAQFQQDFVSLLGTDVEIACAAEPERVERLIVPGQGFGLGNMIEGTDEYREMMTSRFAAEIKPDGNDKLYISRSKLPAGRGNLIGEPELEKRLESLGYTIYHPEKHDIRHQIATYKAANKVIAAEGSALHLLGMVADPEADIAIIVRRPSGATRNLELHLTSFKGTQPLLATHLVRSWKPFGKAKPRLWMGELDMPALQKELAEGGFIRKNAKKWSSLDPIDVQERLGDEFEEVA